MTFLIELALGWGWKKWLAQLFGWAVPVLALIVLGGAIYASIYQKGEASGAAKVTAKVQQQHDQAVTDSRTDERAAAATSAAIGAGVARANDDATRSAAADQEKIHDQISALPVARPGDAVPAAADTGLLAASLDALVDRANRAAQAAPAR